jgi:hypothetical protein
VSAETSAIPEDIKPVLIVILLTITVGGAGLSGWIFLSAIREKHSIEEELQEIV